MKKYLMGGIAAVAICAAFTSCSKNNDVFDQNAVQQMEEQKKQEALEENIAKVNEQYAIAFEKAFGKVGSNVDWGFGSTKASTRANAGKNYPQTSEGINANGNEWADPNKNYGGWLVPDPLTEGQIERVRKYFQANPNLDFKDPEWRHFFVQQVYKGGTAVGSNSTETITAANNSTYNSSHMNKLTVGQNNLHINNFNSGDCSVYGNVLDNGQTVNGGTTHSDKIQLMVNIDDTSCFGYYESGASIQVNNKAALVSAATIDAWAAANGNPGEAVVDKWNRSFMGFDHALKEGADALDAATVKYNDGPESYNYALVNGEVVSIDGNSEILINGKPIQYASTNTNMYVAAEKTNMSDGDIQAEYRVNGDYKGKYINVDNIMAKLNAGWTPVKDKNLREWVKIGTSDGYFSDWIVTLTEAKRQDEKPTPTYRVIAEDLNAEEASDFDFNDVVFDVEPNEAGNAAKIVVRAAGGIYKLTVAGQEVHAAFGQTAKADGLYPMINTQPWNPDVKATLIESYSGDFSSDAAIRNTIKNIEIKVYKPGFEENGIELSAQTGKPACKILVDQTFNVVTERTGIADKNTNFNKYVQGTWDTTTNGFWWKKN